VPHRKAATVLLLLCAAWACAPRESAAAQTPAARRGIALRTKGRRSVVVRMRGRAHTLDLSKHVDAMRIQDATELFLTRKGGFVYLLLDVCGPSKVRPDNRHCGAGTECNLVWLKLDRAWRERDAKSEPYESCWKPITSELRPRVKGRHMVLEYDDLTDWVRREVDYDADKPEEGLTFKFWAIPKQ
jgi:hypothetical protein